MMSQSGHWREWRGGGECVCREFCGRETKTLRQRKDKDAGFTRRKIKAGGSQNDKDTTKPKKTKFMWECG